MLGRMSSPDLFKTKFMNSNIQLIETYAKRVKKKYINVHCNNNNKTFRKKMRKNPTLKFFLRQSNKLAKKIFDPL